MSGRFLLLLHIAARHLLVRQRQSLVAICGVTVGVGFFLAVSALMIGSQNDFVKRLIDAAPHIIVSDELRSPPPQPGLRANPGAAVELHGYKVRNEVRGIKGWQRIIRAAEQVDGAIASPSLTGAVTLRLGGREEPLGLIGIDPAIEERISTISENLASGHLADLERVQGGVIIGEEMAERLGLRLGDMVAATSATGATRSLRIVGTIKRGEVALGGGTTGYMLLREVQSLLGRPFVINRIGIRLPDPDDADLVARRLEARFTYKAQSWQERSVDFLSMLVTRNVIMYTVISAILLVASFGIYTAVSNSVADKRRDIAIMRSMGFSQGDLQLVFVIEGLALAVAGIVVGWLLGFGLIQILSSIEFPALGEGEKFPVDDSPAQYLLAAAASLLTGVVAAWLPARKSARVDPVDILRGAA